MAVSVSSTVDNEGLPAGIEDLYHCLKNLTLSPICNRL